jgi:hypothetical protein
MLCLALILLAGLAVWNLGDYQESSPPPPTPQGATDRNADSKTNKLHELEEAESLDDQTTWHSELLAGRCGQVIEGFWDVLNRSTNRLGVAATFSLGNITVGNGKVRTTLPHQIEFTTSTHAEKTLSPQEWDSWLERLRGDRWQLHQIEARHNQFTPPGPDGIATSRFYFRADLTNPDLERRVSLEGDVLVRWDCSGPSNKPPEIRHIDASGLTVKQRTGQVPFQLQLREEIVPHEKHGYVDPLIIYDLDQDGFSEVLLVANNRVYRRTNSSQYKAESLVAYPLDTVFTAIVADFNRDGHPDLLCSNTRGLYLYLGSVLGTFDDPPKLIWEAHPRLINPMVLTCGDIDGDGDLDIFLGQYRVPTLGQILLPAYHDARDSHPGYLLRNDGTNGFTDITTAAGLTPKRHRRIYSATFVDLDGDGSLDLALASDFAGADIFRNDGHGHFSDVTTAWLPESHGFGMAQVVGDFNRDGITDYLMIGMNSPTVSRLDFVGAHRHADGDDPSLRSRMTYGNRLYLGKPGGGFFTNQFTDSIARSGWSWGASSLDFDNDGFSDLCIVNGHESQRTVRDYEPEFWTHDLYIGHQVDDSTATSYFMKKFARTRGDGWSYGGFEKNRLFLNHEGREFAEIGHLFGLASELDSRNMVAEDLDRDGRVDLLFTTFEVWPEPRQTLWIYQNALPNTGNWIGFRLRESSAYGSPVGATVRLRTREGMSVRQVVTGDSYRSQHSTTVHFGLGTMRQISEVEVQWANGQKRIVTSPGINLYHDIP